MVDNTTTEFGYNCLLYASSWVAPDWLPEQICIESGSNNHGECIDEVQKLFYNSPSDAAYCASFQWTVINEVCKSMGFKNPIPKSVGAGAKIIIDYAKKAGLLVNIIPRPGAIWRRTSTASNSGFHVGMVLQLTEDGFYTIEGNTSFSVNKNGVRKTYNGIGVRFYTYDKIIPLSFNFAHVQFIGNTPNATPEYQAKAGFAVLAVEKPFYKKTSSWVVASTLVGGGSLYLLYKNRYLTKELKPTRKLKVVYKGYKNKIRKAFK